MVLYETLNIMDVQLIDKQLCTSWKAGAAVTGIINDTGLLAVTPPGRNTGAWTAFHEGWRFQRPFATNIYQFTKCDDDTDGFVNFNLQVVQNDLSPANPSLVSLYETQADAVSKSNALTNLNYTNTTANSQTIFDNVNGEIRNVHLQVVDCNNDYDQDSVATADEDVNGDTNLANDDIDLDGIPNFIDNDDDGDTVLTSVEYVFNRSTSTMNAYLDADNDGILNYLYNDDDGDGILTINEDANGNHNPLDDDADSNGTPDYLQNPALATSHFEKGNSIVLYTNPANAILNIENTSGEKISRITISDVNGSLIREIKAQDAGNSISVSDLQSGIYFVKIVVSNAVINYKFIKK